MNENNFCYFDDDEYNVSLTLTSAYRTSGPTTSTSVDTSEVSNFRVWANMGFSPYVEITSIHGNPFPHLKHYLKIETPADPTNTSLKEMIMKHITSVGELPIRSHLDNEMEGFNIVFNFNDLDLGQSVIFDTASGPQDDSFLEITELEVVKFPNEVRRYVVTFRFSCKLYYYRSPFAFFGDLENAEMKLEFEI